MAQDMQSFLAKIVTDYEEIIRTVSGKLEDVRRFAKENNIVIRPSSLTTTSSIQEEVQRRHKELREQADQIRKQAIAQAEQLSQSAKVPGMGNIPNMGMNSMPMMPVRPKITEKEKDE